MPVIKTIVLTVVSVLAIGVSGVGLNAAFGKDITLVVDGQSLRTKVLYGSVAEVLSNEGISLDSRDRVNPEPSAVVSNDMTITVQYARPISLTLDGQKGTYWTYATTVAGIVSNLGLSESTIRVSLDQKTDVPRQGLTLEIETGHDVTVTANGQTQNLHAFGEVRHALDDLNLVWDGDDIVTPAADSALSDNLTITLVKVDQVTVTREVVIDYATESTEDPEATKGKVTVTTAGVAGAKTQTVVQTLHDGQVVSEEVTAEQVTREPVTQVQTVGTKVVAVSVDPGSAQAIAYDMVIARGWDDAEFNCLVNLWNRESGWRVNAANASSGAYGIPQALPGSKMASAGADWQTNPATQITWGLGYISGRYGTPCGAWNAFLSKGWY